MHINGHITINRLLLVTIARGDADRASAGCAQNHMAGETTRPIRVVIAGGGTGGHLFPGIAVAQEIQNRSPLSDILFIGTDREFEKSVLDANGFQHTAIRVQGLKGRGLVQQVQALMMLPFSLITSARILSGFKPDLVMGVGGYSAGPVVAAAWISGIRTAIQEQNILPGITNRLLSRITDRLYLSFKETRGMTSTSKSLVTGNPVRREFLASSVPTHAGSPKQNGTFTVLVAGGSQGAHAINMAMLDAAAIISGGAPVHIIHQTGTDDEERVRRAYTDSRIGSTVKAFFNDMVRQYQRADLVICRAGATSVAELTVLGKPVIFIPYPYAADDHHRIKAESLVSAGASEMIPQENLSGKLLAERIRHYINAPAELSEMAARAGSLGRPDAARAIVDDMYQLIGC